jgi:toxin ParE1/3/4
VIIKWLDDAITDLQSLRQYIAIDSPSAANRVAKRIIDAAELLSLQPHIGRHGRVPNTRELIVSDTPYIIPYRIRGNAIEILGAVYNSHW